jgi:hypothetical protein
MKTIKKQRSNVRRKPIRQPKPMKIRVSESDDKIAMKPEDMPRFVDMLKAVHRAKLALMPADVAMEYNRLTRAIATEEEQARGNAIADQYEPSDAQIHAALGEIEAEYERKSRGSMAEDMKAASAVTLDLFRKTLSDEERGEFDAAVQREGDRR